MIDSGETVRVGSRVCVRDGDGEVRFRAPGGVLSVTIVGVNG